MICLPSIFKLTYINYLNLDIKYFIFYIYHLKYQCRAGDKGYKIVCGLFKKKVSTVTNERGKFIIQIYYYKSIQETFKKKY